LTEGPTMNCVLSWTDNTDDREVFFALSCAPSPQPSPNVRTPKGRGSLPVDTSAKERDISNYQGDPLAILFDFKAVCAQFQQA
jgi:hypothetical protein